MGDFPPFMTDDDRSTGVEFLIVLSLPSVRRECFSFRSMCKAIELKGSTGNVYFSMQLYYLRGEKPMRDFESERERKTYFPEH